MILPPTNVFKNCWKPFEGEPKIFSFGIIIFSKKTERVSEPLHPNFYSGLPKVRPSVFASTIKGAASGLSYATFLIQAPLGIISNTILIPLLPLLSELRSKGNTIILTEKAKETEKHGSKS